MSCRVAGVILRGLLGVVLTVGTLRGFAVGTVVAVGTLRANTVGARTGGGDAFAWVVP